MSCWAVDNQNIGIVTLEKDNRAYYALMFQTEGRPHSETMRVNKAWPGVLFDKSKKTWKIGSKLGSPFGLEDKAP